MSAFRLCAVAILALGLAAPAAAGGRKEKVAARSLALADAVARVGQWDMAARMYREASTANPDDAAAWAGLGQALVESGHAADALAALDRAATLAPGRADIARLRGRATLALGRVADARAAFTAATTEAPADPRGWTGLGVALDLGGDHRAAQIAYGRALAADPLNLAARNDLALSLALDGKLADAANRLRPLADAADAPARVRANLAFVEAATHPAPPHRP